MAQASIQSGDMRVLKAIKSGIGKNGWAPSYREIGQKVGMTSPSSVMRSVNRLVESGYLQKVGENARTIRLTRKGKSANA
jgi:repressor LexA